MNRFSHYVRQEQYKSWWMFFPQYRYKVICNTDNRTVFQGSQDECDSLCVALCMAYTNGLLKGRTIAPDQTVYLTEGMVRFDALPIGKNA